MKHAAGIISNAELAGIRVKRAGSDVWEDHVNLIGLPQGADIMRAKCIDCGAVNAISAHESDSGDVGWGCAECGTMQVIVPASLEQRPFDTTVKPAKGS